MHIKGKERHHRNTSIINNSSNTTSTTSEIFICFTSRLSSSSMEISSKSILSPGCTREPSQIFLSSSLSKILRSNCRHGYWKHCPFGQAFSKAPSSFLAIIGHMEGRHFVGSVMSFVTVPFYVNFEVRNFRYEFLKFYLLLVKFYYFMYKYSINYQINFIFMKFT